MTDWSKDFEAAKLVKENSGQVVAEIVRGVFQVIHWDADTEAWRENTNQMRLRFEPLRWRPIGNDA